VKKIWSYVRNHLKEDFKLSYYVVIFLFLAVCLTINYQYHFYSNVLQVQTGFTKFAYYFLFYAFAYTFAIGTFVIIKKRHDVLTKKNFWFKSFLIVTIISFDHSLPFLRPFIYNFFPYDIQLWSLKVINNISSLFTVIIPVLLFYHFKENQEKHVYGFQIKHFDFKPYIVLLLCMIPMIIGASFTKGFQQQYPMYKTSDAHLYFNVPEWVTTGIYELAYGFDFVAVEFLFRGFMVIGMISVLGRSAVLSMAVAYCFLHFGKPAGEAISSIFGGYIIGVIAYETKSIWGGILIHLGIAWGMECAAYLQHLKN
jgi:hypothetical protein